MTHTAEAISWRRALEIVLDAAPVKEVETLDMTSALGRALAFPIISPADYPSFNRSSMDGYAVRSADTFTPPVMLRNVGTITAGILPSVELQPGQCARIMTGAPLPRGGDAVVRTEDTAGNEADIQVRIAVPPGQYCVMQGTEFKKGQELFPAGIPITATEIGVMAEFGMQRVQVHKVPTVALLVTGDELVEPWVQPRSGQIRNSNAYVFLTLLRLMGVPAHYLGICPDNSVALSQKVLSGLQDDVLIMVGGTARGDHDFTLSALESQGMQIVFDRLAINPGRSTLFARKGAKLAFGLPGPPMAMRTICHLLVLPLLKKMMGYRNPLPTMYTGTFKGTFVKSSGMEFFVAARAEFRESGFVLESSSTQAIWCQDSCIGANALVQVGSDLEQLQNGDKVSFLFINPW